jgi:hypothetical protein
MGRSAHGRTFCPCLRSDAVGRSLFNSRGLAVLGAALGFLLTVGGLALPEFAVAGGSLFAVLGTCLAYDIRGLGARWIAWERSLGAPNLGLSVWLQRTLDGAAITCLGVAVAWASAVSLL